LTVNSQVQQALATARSIQANFETFSQQTKDEEAKQMYADAAKELETVVDGLEKRMGQIRQEEPQFSVRQ
jgi:molecular chaperone GrpE (heat shock protein)